MRDLSLRINLINHLENYRINKLKTNFPQRRSNGWLLFIGTLFFILGWISTSEAHDPGLSAVNIKIDKAQIDLHLSIARSDMPMIRETHLNHQNLEDLILRTIALYSDTQRLIPKKILIEFDKAKAIDFYLKFDGVNQSTLRYSCLSLEKFPSGHRQYVSLVDENKNNLANQLLSEKNNSCQINLENRLQSQTEDSSFAEFLTLGIKHIFLGYDHIAFLLMVLLASGCLKTAIKIITSFTCAHSITLALATLNLVSIPSSIAEILIAFSILYIALENIFKKNITRRYLSTFGFGLIHGFGFASVLHELGVEASVQGIAVPLLSFNLGVEIGQIAIAMVVLPFILKAQSQPRFSYRLIQEGSIVVSLIACYWIFERVIMAVHS